MAGMTYFPQTLISLVQPAAYAVAARLFVLTTGRAGSKKFRPTISNFYETGIVTALYEQMLMCPTFKHLDIRHEMPYQGPKGAPKQVDLWSRHLDGAHPQLIEAGDFSVGKVHYDLKKAMALNPKGASWFLAFFRDRTYGATDPWPVISKSLTRANGLDPTLVKAKQAWTTAFSVYRPDGNHDLFGAALLRGK
jgi:hypothetical protein